MYELFCILQLPEHMDEANKFHSQKEHLRAMEMLNEVKIKCRKRQAWVKIIINILISLGLPPEVIVIEETLEHPL
jgi:hypothetical protein